MAFECGDIVSRQHVNAGEKLRVVYFAPIAKYRNTIKNSPIGMQLFYGDKIY